ncbi:MAG: choice-of-anchor L domain-containing protein [Micrococcaceae bacterium]|nr:choice-of-anchor L domain-containing protein [Micrococcaceae bacterium]
MDISVAAPAGIPALAIIKGDVTAVGAKLPEQTSSTTTVTVPAGTYTVAAAPITWEGVRYTAAADDTAVDVNKDDQLIAVTFAKAPGLQRLRPTALEPTKVALTWDGSPNNVTLRRVTGDQPPVSETDGVSVPVVGSGAVDEGLIPGTTYAYTAFTGDASMSVVVGTGNPDADEFQSFMYDYTTVVLDGDSILSWSKIDDEHMTLELADEIPTPIPGSAVVIQPWSQMESGHLGLVQQVSDDGRTLTLGAAGLGDALAFIDFKMGEPDLPEEPVAPEPETPQPEVSPSPSPPSVPTRPGTSKPAIPFVPSPGKPGLPNTGSAAAKADKTCEGGGSLDLLVEAPELKSVDRTMALWWDHYNLFGAQVKKSFNVQAKFTWSLTMSASVEAKGEMTCAFKILKKLPANFAIGPVPFVAMIDPKVEASASGSLQISDIGFSTTIGFEVNGSLGLDGITPGKSGPIFTAKALTPTSSLKGRVGIDVGANVSIGPGSAVSESGAYAGVFADLRLVEAGFEGVLDTAGACAELGVASTVKAGLRAEVFFGSWSATGSMDLFTKNLPWPSSPIVFPKNCGTTPNPGDVSDDIVGPGIEVVDSELGGSATQWGQLEGLVPGQKTWVLSTGNVDDVLGVPLDFASTDLGLPGNQQLTEMSGYSTYDAVSYSATLIPKGSTLHVRYAFASEEYPEYVGSQFNDVMAVFVNGKNCAVIPGTNEAVSVNTVNAQTKSEYFIDNSAGAAGYGTSLDGITTPLTCSVAVSPNQPVTVVIAVADGSDAVLDSAVALLDKGIWSD